MRTAVMAGGRWMIGGLAAVCLLSAAVAQEKPDIGKLLEKEVGVWDAVIKFQQGNEALEMPGVERNTLRGGLWLVTDFESDFGGVTFEGHGVRGYDPKKEKVVNLWVDSMQPFFAHMEGEYDADGNLTMTGEYPDPSGVVKKWKSVCKWTDDDHRLFKMMMAGDDGEFQELMTIEYARRADDAEDEKKAAKKEDAAK